MASLSSITETLNHFSRELNKQANENLPQRVTCHLQTFTKLDTDYFELRCDESQLDAIHNTLNVNPLKGCIFCRNGTILNKPNVKIYHPYQTLA